MKNHRSLLIAFLILPLLSAQLLAQIGYWPYYGKSRVLYTDFQWKHYPTEHFDIYYYTDDADTLKTIVEMAESSYQSISLKTKHALSARVPIIYYSTHTEFEQSNLFQPSEGVLGVSEPLLYRVAIQGDMPKDELQDLVAHELSHIFEFDLLWGSPGGAVYAMNSPPLWIMEGFSEYNTEKWSAWSELIVRDAVLNDRIPELTRSGQLFSRHPLPRDPAYDFGHAMYDYIEARYGKNGVANLWQSLKDRSLFSRTNPIRRALGKDYKQFTYEFRKHIREKYKPFLMRENPEDYSITLGPEYPLNEYWFAFSHAASPSGELIAVMTYNVRDLDLDILLLSAKDGEVIRNLTKGYSLKYEYLKFEIEPSNGRDIAWSADGDKIAFFARSGQKHALFIIDVVSGKIIKKTKLPQDQPASPSFAFGDQAIIFAAFEKGDHDIFKVHLETGEVENLTQDDLYEKAPSVSPDGKLIAYTIRLDAYDKLFVSPIDDLEKKTQLTFGRGHTITPEFGPDSQEIYFSGNQRESYNIYSIHLQTGELKRYTDVRTGNFLPVPVRSEDNTIIFSSFNKGAFQIFKSQLEGEVEKVVTLAQKPVEEGYQRFEPMLSIEIDNEKIAPYKGMGKLYIIGRPPVDTLVTTDGSIYGGSSLAFADLFHDHQFTLTAYQVQTFRSYSFSYVNQRKRLQWGASAYSYTFFYYPSYAYFDPSLFYRLSYRDALATRTMSGVQVLGYYPFNIYYRLHASLGYSYYEEDFSNADIGMASGGFQSYNYFWNGSNLSASLSLIGETTRFKSYGPAKGHTFRISLSQSVPVSDAFIQNTNLDVDVRQYLYIGADTLFAVRVNGFASRGRNPYIRYYGGNNEVRSVNFYSLIGTEGWFANLEFRFPIINAALTILGNLGPIRGTFFLDMTRNKVGDNPARFILPEFDEFGRPRFRFIEALGSYGFGIEFFVLGLPLHIDFVKSLNWEKFSEPFSYESVGEWRTKFWIGFDF